MTSVRHCPSSIAPPPRRSFEEWCKDRISRTETINELVKHPERLLTFEDPTIVETVIDQHHKRIPQWILQKLAKRDDAVGTAAKEWAVQNLLF